MSYSVEELAVEAVELSIKLAEVPHGGDVNPRTFVLLMERCELMALPFESVEHNHIRILGVDLWANPAVPAGKLVPRNPGGADGPNPVQAVAVR